MLPICKNKTCKFRNCPYNNMSIAQAIGVLRAHFVFELNNFDDDSEDQAKICEMWRKVKAFAIIENEAKSCKNLHHLDGPWNNDACKGYAIMAMERAGLDPETIGKVSRQMTLCFDDTAVKEAAQHYYGGRY